MNPPSSLGQFDHDSRSKRQRTSSPSHQSNPHIDSILPRRQHSPFVAINSSQLAQNNSADDISIASSSNSGRELFTQPPDVAPSPAALPPPVVNVSNNQNASVAEDNSTIEAPPIVEFEDISMKHISIIARAAKALFGVEAVRDFQFEAINHLAFEDDTYTVLIRRTADGKSLVPLCTAAIRRGITLVLVPLHGLGVDQCQKAAKREAGFNAYYVDEYKGVDMAKLQKRLLAIDDEEARSTATILFVSPQSLHSKSPWMPTFETLSQRGMIELYCVDEAHTVEQCGRCFREEFVDSCQMMGKLNQMGPSPKPRLAMSATLRQKDQDRVTGLLGQMEPNVMRGDLSRRSTNVRCVISGQSSATLYKSAEEDLKSDPDAQQMWYANTAHACENELLKKADDFLEKHVRSKGKEAVAQPFVGSDGFGMKATTMMAFTNFGEADGEPEIVDGVVKLARILILLCTTAANAGVSSLYMKYCKHKDLPRNLYDLVQMMGRVNRDLRQRGCTFQIHLCFRSAYAIYASCMSNEDKLERVISNKQWLEVLRCLVAPSECYHSYFEKYFDPCASGGKCNNCSFCSLECAEYTGRIDVGKLRGVLTSTFLMSKAVLAKDFVGILKKKKSLIFHKDDVPGDKDVAPLHALALQLIAVEVVQFEIKDVSKIGTKKIRTEDITLKLGLVPDDDGNLTPAYLTDPPFQHLTTC